MGELLARLDDWELRDLTPAERERRQRLCERLQSAVRKANMDFNELVYNVVLFSHSICSSTVLTSYFIVLCIVKVYEIGLVYPFLVSGMLSFATTKKIHRKSSLERNDCGQHMW